MELTNEEAAKIIGCMGWGYPEKQIEKASQMAAKALRGKSEAEEYRTPKKPIKIFPRDISGHPIDADGACRTCGKLVSRTDNYCKHCGQKLEWTEEEENNAGT